MAKVVFVKGTSKPWKIMDNKGNKVGEAVTKALAEEKIGTIGSGKSPKPDSEGGIDDLLDKAVETSKPSIKGKVKGMADKMKSYRPMRGQLEGEAPMETYSDDNEQ